MNQKGIFHLAIPTHDLEKCERFYGEMLECHIARKYDDRITLNFMDHQLVCHLTDESNIDQNPQMYPRHFGFTFESHDEYRKLTDLIKKNNIPTYKKEFVRFKGLKEEHHAVFLIDPSNNLLEFKYYLNKEMMF